MLLHPPDRGPSARPRRAVPCREADPRTTFPATQDPILKAKVALDPSGGLEVPMRPPMLADMVDKLKEAIGLYEKANARVLAIEVRGSRRARQPGSRPCMALTRGRTTLEQACVKGARYVLHFRKRLVVCELLARANDNRVDLSIAEQVRPGLEGGRRVGLEGGWRVGLERG